MRAHSGPANPSPPAPLPAPAVTGPLQQLPPAVFRAGPFGNSAANGILSGVGLAQNHPVPGDKDVQVGMTNGQIILQRTDGWVQFYLQAGVYDLPKVGVSFLQTDEAVNYLYGPLPVAFLKLQPAKNTSIAIRSLPTVIGGEYTFSFENMNIERGLLWNQEPAVSRGIQLNQTLGMVSASAVGITASIRIGTPG